jgi:DNA invertase Pin-like site-specific DNA recombinase
MPRADGRKLRAADYQRYSTDLQLETSIEDQARICRERIAHEGGTHIRSYQDRAMSSASRWRPAFQQMIKDAKRGQFDVVVAEALDRLSRIRKTCRTCSSNLASSACRSLP